MVSKELIRNDALPQKSCATFASDLPPDVRRGLYPAETGKTIPGYALGFGLSPSDLLGQRTHEGHSPKVKAISTSAHIPASQRAAKPKRRYPMTFEAMPRSG